MKVMFLQNSKKIEIKQIVLIIFLITIISVSSSFADQLKIFSDKLEINRENKMSIFTGNVYAHETEFEIWAENLKVQFKLGSDKNEIETIYVNKNVKIIRENTTATSETGLYLPMEDKIVLNGNVNVIEDGNIINCDELMLDLKNSTSIMKSNSTKRVEAIINESIN